MSNTLWKFLYDTGTFVAKNPHRLSRLSFPLANEEGILSSISPTMHGDIKIDQYTFLTIPASTEDLHDSRYNRNFWIYIDGYSAWSAASGETDKSLVEAGMLWHKSIRVNKKIGLKAEFLNFVPVTNEPVELMTIELTNISDKTLKITPTAAVPIYGRSADRLRDHRHVSSLLNRIKLDRYGVIVTPTMSFDERGHKINSTSYFVLGYDSLDKPPIGSFPTLLEYSGEGGNLDKPESVLKNKKPRKDSEFSREGKEAIGALRFKTINLSPRKSVTYTILMGITKKERPERIFGRFDSREKVKAALTLNKKFWTEKINAIKLSTYDKDFDRWMRWVTLQPTLRKIFGCSFLPDFDYGRGGRGWRDLWQDLLTLLIINPKEARNNLVNNFGGVRTDGSNATIIGKNPGEFIPDRNNISRVWMDHGVWPFKTVNLYINQTGDTSILFEKVPYFESGRIDTVLNHILLEHKRPFTKIGRHGNFLLEGGDWNDGLDMAREKGESVAFTAGYAGNLTELTQLLEKINYKKEIAKELRRKADRVKKYIREKEWITVKSGHSFFNGYYDNNGKRVEGGHKNGVRMTLTGQVFPIMSGVATEEQAREAYRSAKRYLWDKNLRGFRLNTDFKETYPELGRAFSFAYGEKENGGFFSHMNVMFANALYKGGLAREGYEVLDSIYNMCMNTKLSKIYPGLPEYFNSDGRGMYHYLTGSASWFVLTVLTQVFGIRGDMGNLLIEPKLVKEQFEKSKIISIETYFAGRKIKINYINPHKLDYGKYTIKEISINGKPAAGMPIKRSLFLKLASKPSINTIDIPLIRLT
ncbi:MAG: cellobiose phosphorylase [Candidatus Omnitrophica bacterium]|nr:cellobiose phosphorylase [Candidatus Omnitrophota bacterium]